MSTRELSAAIGVSESSLKRWIDAGRISASRTGGGHRRVPVSEAIRFVREQRTPIARPDLLDLPEIAVDRARGERLVTYLLEGDGVAARGYLISRYLEGVPVADLADGPIRDAMHALGERWHHDENGIFVEHRGTEICLQAVAQLRMMMRAPAASAPVAVGGAPCGDPYRLPSQLASLAVAEAGMNPVDLGPDTPLSALEAAIAAHRAKLMWLSISTALTPARARSLVSWLDRLPGTVVVVVGGQQAHGVDRMPAHVTRAASMAQLDEIAASVVERSREIA